MAGSEWRMTYRIVGTRGEATAMNYVLPHLDDRVIVRTGAEERVEELGKRSSYTYQLEAVATCLRHANPVSHHYRPHRDNMQLIDDCYVRCRLHHATPETRRAACLTGAERQRVGVQWARGR
jgi:hypothetical protein